MIYRVLTLAVVLPVYPVKISLLDQTRYDRLAEMKVSNFPSIDYTKIFSKKYLLKANISDFNEFYLFARKRFEQFRSHLEKSWGIQSESELQSIFYMNLVSGMWHYGNLQKEGPGCVLVNENTGFQEMRASSVSIRTYIDSDIGCCTDYANLLKFLLDKAGIKNRLVKLPGHIFNEAYFENRWNVLDATLNITFNAPWESIQFSSENNISVTTFPHINLIKYNNPYYNPEVGALRIQQILFASEKDKQKPVYGYELPGYIK